MIKSILLKANTFGNVIFVIVSRGRVRFYRKNVKINTKRIRIITDRQPTAAVPVQ